MPGRRRRLWTLGERWVRLVVEICGVEGGMGEDGMGGGREVGKGEVGFCGCGWFEGLLFWAVVVMNVVG